MGFDGSRVQDWEMLGGTAGDDVRQTEIPLLSHPVLTHIPDTSEAQHYSHIIPRMVLLLRQVLQRKVTGT